GVLPMYVDADTHVVETDRAWSYLEPSERVFAPVAVNSVDDGPGGRTWWLVGDQWFIRITPVESAVQMAARDLSDIPARLAWMDRLGVAVQVLFPSFFLMTIQKRSLAEAALARSYARWMADVHTESKGRIRWAVVPALSDLPATLELLEFGKRHG